MTGTQSYEGETLPFTRDGWTRQLKSGRFRNGATWKHVEKVRAVGRGSMGAELEEVHILASWDTDQGGNKTVNKRKGQHSLSLAKGKQEIAFAIQDKNEWRILSYDCYHYETVKTQREAESILSAIKWRKWKKGGKKR